MDQIAGRPFGCDPFTWMGSVEDLLVGELLGSKE